MKPLIKKQGQSNNDVLTEENVYTLPDKGQEVNTDNIKKTHQQCVAGENL